MTREKEVLVRVTRGKRVMVLDRFLLMMVMIMMTMMMMTVMLVTMMTMTMMMTAAMVVVHVGLEMHPNRMTMKTTTVVMIPTMRMGGDDSDDDVI